VIIGCGGSNYAGELQNYDYPAEAIAKATKNLPKN
jgi:hypothetical protein